MKVFLQVRFDHIWGQTRQTGEPGDSFVEVHEAFDNEVSLSATVGAALRAAVHEGVVCADIVRTGTPLRWVLRYRTKEDENAEASA